MCIHARIFTSSLYICILPVFFMFAAVRLLSLSYKSKCNNNVWKTPYLRHYELSQIMLEIQET